MKKTIILSAATFASIGSAAAEPAFVEPRLVEVRPVEIGVRKALKTVEFMGRDVTFSAYGPRASADNAFFRDAYRESSYMAKVSPGYPQPPRLTFEIRISL